MDNYSTSSILLTFFLFYFKNTKYFNIYTQREREKSFKETNSGVYLKGSNLFLIWLNVFDAKIQSEHKHGQLYHHIVG